MRHPRRAAPFVVIAGLALVLTACTDEADAAGEWDQPTPSASPTGADRADESSTPEPASPLDEFWASVFSGDLTDQLVKQTEAEVLVAECMAEQGWEYFPVDFVALNGDTRTGTIPERQGRTALEFAQEFGYGVATIDWGQYEELDEEVDPNQEYRDSLSEQARELYMVALTGSLPPTPEEIAAGEVDPATDLGCLGVGDAAVFSTPDSLYEDPTFEALAPELNLIEESVRKHPDLLAASAQWTACMSEAGHPSLIDSDGAEELVLQQLWAYTDDGIEPTARQLAEIGDLERAIATADILCTEQVGLDEARAAARHEVEQAFIDNHRAELEYLMNEFGEQDASGD